MPDTKKSKLFFLLIIISLVLTNTLIRKSRIGIIIVIVLAIEIALILKHD